MMIPRTIPKTFQQTSASPKKRNMLTMWVMQPHFLEVVKITKKNLLKKNFLELASIINPKISNLLLMKWELLSRQSNQLPHNTAKLSIDNWKTSKTLTQVSSLMSVQSQNKKPKVPKQTCFLMKIEVLNRKQNQLKMHAIKNKMKTMVACLITSSKLQCQRLIQVGQMRCSLNQKSSQLSRRLRINLITLENNTNRQTIFR